MGRGGDDDKDGGLEGDEEKTSLGVLAAVDRRGTQCGLSNDETSRPPVSRLCAKRERGDGFIHGFISWNGQGRPWQGVGVNAVGGIGDVKCWMAGWAEMGSVSEINQGRRLMRFDTHVFAVQH